MLTAPGPVVTVPVGALRSAGSPRTAGADLDHVRALAGTPGELPPIVVHRATMRVVDGLHRLQAARLRRQREIAVRFFDGDAADAFVFAVRANVVHGLPLSTADRKAAGRRIVASHPQWSDRLIASVTGLSPRTIADLRRRAAPAAPARRRIGRDGRARPVNSLEQRRQASDLLRENPDLSLRQVAAVVGISPETVRTVRARLLGGEDPVLPRARGAGAGAGTGTTSTTTTGAGTGAATLPARDPARTPAPDPTRAVRRLRADPSLRFTETGRTLLRLLDAHTLSSEKWTALVQEVPPHTRQVIAKLATECADGWRLLAEQLAQDTQDSP